MTDFNIRLGQQQKFKVTVQTGGVGVPARFSDLIDFDGDDVSDQYVLMYDASSKKWKAVNPDKVLISAAETEPNQPGLPGEFLDRLDVDLDNRIDTDGGDF
jgi:uncharacterized protein YrzB (UPF0473 family)